jgi:Ca2+-transporting ATPase
MFGLLIASGVIYFLLGDRAEALALLAFASVSVLVTIVQETRSERVLTALRELSSPRALVIRGEQRQRIPGREVVRGDVMLLSEGDRVPADGTILSCDDLLVDESLLTGESVPVRKAVGARGAPPARAGGEDLPFVFSGSLVVRGNALVVVSATGPRSEIGKIGATLGAIENTPPRLTLQTRRLVRQVAVAGLTVCLLAVLLFGLMRGDWLQALLAGLALGMSMLPEEFPLVLTVFMAMGAWRISRARVLTRRAAAIEALGSATVLCTDKTGTLTENRMRIAELRAGATIGHPGEAADLPEPCQTLLEFGLLASTTEGLDPMDQAFHALAAMLPVASSRHLVRSWGLRPDLLAVTQAWQVEGETDYLVAAKGAPEAVARLCGLEGAALGRFRADLDEMAQAGLRVLGVARASSPGAPWPASPHGFDFTFLGLVGMADPLRATVPAAVHECRTAGIRVIMITGDHAATARAIARQAGVDVGRVLTGEEMERLDDGALAAESRATSIFARILPTQKLRIVRALQADGEVVAMTGDGVNDAPSLKAADIGIAMGGRGTDVAREAASIVLLDDDFGSIVQTIRLGRRIYDNLRKAMGYILAVHVPIAGLALLPLLLGMPLMFAPIHIAFLEMVIDPVCSIVFEAEHSEDDIMRRPPRSPATPLFSRGLVIWSLLQGGFAFVLIAAVYLLGLERGMPAEEVRALAFITLLLTNVGLIFINRSFSTSLLTAITRRNPALWIVIGVVLPLLLITVRWGPAEALFSFGPLHADDLAICISAAVILLAVLESLKRRWRTMLTS